jgi:hypothetical protein
MGNVISSAVRNVVGGDTFSSLFARFFSQQGKVSESSGDVEEWRNLNNDDVFAVTTLGTPQFSSNEVVFDRVSPSMMVVRGGITSTVIDTAFLPNGAQGQNPSGGFTNTGLDRLPNGNWLVGNDGRATEAAAPNNASLVVLSADKKTIVTELDMSGATLANGGSVQGVTVAPDGSYWFAAPSEQKIIHVSNAGAKLGEINIGAAANGCAYDDGNAAIWVSTQGSSTCRLYRASDGVVLNTIDITAAADQLSYDEATSTLAVTFGDNGQPGSVIFYNVDIDLPVAEIPSLPDAEAIEGIYIDYSIGNGEFSLCHDGGFHTNATPARSIIYTYSVDQPLALETHGFIGAHFDITLNGDAPSNRETIISLGSPDGASEGGWAVYVTSSNTIRLQIRSKTTADIWFAEYPIVRGVDFTFSVYADLDANTFYAEINGVETMPENTLNNISDLDDELCISYHTVGRKDVGTVYPASVSFRKLIISESLKRFNEEAAALRT